MYVRKWWLLLSPEGGDGGGATATTQTGDTTTKTDAGSTTTQTQTVQSITITQAEYAAFVENRQKLAAFESEKQRALDAKEQERLKVLAEKQGVESALAEQQKAWESKHADAKAEAAKLRGRIHTAAKDSVLKAAFSGVTLIGDTPEQRARTQATFERAWADDFEVIEDGSGNPVVVERGTRTPAVDVLANRLKAEDFKQFLAATRRTGGTGSDATRTTTEVDKTDIQRQIIDQYNARKTPAGRGLFPSRN